MSRHRKIQLSRAKAIVLAAAGALSVATAASATAATWSSGSSGLPAGSAHGAADALRLSVTDRLAQPQANLAAQQTAVTLALRAYQLRLAQTQFAVAQWRAAQHRAAAALAARKAAAARATQARLAEAGSASASQSQSQSQGSSQSQSQSQGSSQSQPQSQPQGSSQQQTGTVAVAASGSPRQIAEAMLGSFGWSSNQFACLDPLWAHESGWSVTAYNPGSGAYGVPQALPGSKMASAGPNWQTNAATQIRWGLRYIKGLYGSPCGAWSHEQATGWY